MASNSFSRMQKILMSIFRLCSLFPGRISHFCGSMPARAIGDKCLRIIRCLTIAAGLVIIASLQRDAERCEQGMVIFLS